MAGSTATQRSRPVSVWADPGPGPWSAEISATPCRDLGAKSGRQGVGAPVPPAKILNEYVRVPAGTRLVFELALQRYDGLCGLDGDTRFVEAPETKTWVLPADGDPWTLHD